MKASATLACPTGLFAVILLSFLPVLTRAQHQDGATVTIRKTVYAHCNCDAPQTTVIREGSSSTASGTGAPASTGQDITIGNFTLRGLVVHDPTDPVECYELPTPTASFPQIAVNVENSAVVTDTPSDISDIIFLYMNSSKPAYLGSYMSGGSGGQTIIDISANATVPGLPVVLPDQSSLVLGDDGIRWFNANCTDERWVEIPDMFSQIEQGVLTRRDLGETSEPETTFLVEVALDKGKGAEEIRPSLRYGADACPLVGSEMREYGDVLTWQCKYPATNPAEQACDYSLSNLTGSYPVRGAGSSDPLNALALIGALFSQSTSLAHLFPGRLSDGLVDASILLGHAFDSLSAALETASSAICNALHEDDPLLLLLAGDDFGTRTVGNFAGAPPTSISVNLATEAPVPRPTRQPTRQVDPSETGFPSETVSGYATEVTIIASETTIVVVGTPSITSGWEPAPSPEGSSSESETRTGNGGAQSVSMVSGSTNTDSPGVARSTQSTMSFVAAESDPTAATYTPESTSDTLYIESTAEPAISSALTESENGSASFTFASESTLFVETDSVSTTTTRNTAFVSSSSDSYSSIPSASVSV